MKAHMLTPAKGAIKKKKRIGRGQGSGKGGTSTRGHKGAHSRSGFKNKRNFEGGQMPMQMRVPKFGFKNPNAVYYNELNLEQLQAYADKFGVTEFDQAFYAERRVTSKSKSKVKILGRGEIKSGFTVHAHKFTKSAKEAIEAAGGQAKTIDDYEKAV